MGSTKRVGQRKMSRSAALYAPVAVLLVLFIGIFGVSVFFRVTEFEVTGNSKYTAEEIIEATGTTKGDYLLLIDSGSAAIKLRAALPYINESRVYRRLPGTVCIEVRESSAVAVISASGSAWVIDTSGMILERTNAVPDGLVTLRGVTPVEPAAGKRISVEAGFETRLEYLLTILSAIDELELQTYVKQLDVTNIARITFTYLDRFSVVLGGADDVRYKLGLMLAYIDTKLTDVETTGTFDLSGNQLSFIMDRD